MITFIYKNNLVETICQGNKSRLSKYYGKMETVTILFTDREWQHQSEAPLGLLVDLEYKKIKHNMIRKVKKEIVFAI